MVAIRNLEHTLWELTARPRSSTSDWLVHSIPGFVDLPWKICVHLNLGPRELSKNLNRVGGIDLGVEIDQHDNTHVRT